MGKSLVKVPEGQPYPMNEKGQRICGAKLQNKDAVCQNTAVMANGRCRFHGGKAVSGVQSGQFKHGRYSKVIKGQLLEDYEQQRTDGDLLTLREEIALVDAMIFERLRAIGNHQTDALWVELQETFETFQTASRLKERDKMRRNLEKMRTLIEQGAGPADERRELLDMIERRRKMVETERRLLVEMGLMMSANDLMTALAVIIDIIEEHVNDGQVRARIGNDIRRLVVARNRGATYRQLSGLDPTRALSGD